jgi:NAD(P)-dependent dehydrogenase (short-subunit alcohol dehydrogenase family)
MKKQRGEIMFDVSQYAIEGKVALITGGSRGIGAATALTFARAGADVAVSSRKLPELEKVANEVRKLGRRALAVEAHIGRMEMIQPLVDRVIAEFGKIDILVNNAGMGFSVPAIEMTEKAWDSVINLDLKGLFFLSQAVVKVMKDKGGCRIINIASVDAFRVEVPLGHYSIAKAGVVMATKVMALEWAKYNVRANCIAPGAVETRLFNSHFDTLTPEQVKATKESMVQRIPVGHLGQPHEIANAILFLASDASSYMMGETLIVDGGSLLR